MRRSRVLTQLYPKLIDLSLERTHRLLGDLGNPHLSLPPVIHIAAPTAKARPRHHYPRGAGSRRYRVTFIPRRIWCASRTHSPGGRSDRRSLLLQVLAHVEAANAGKPITFFEVTTAVAFLAFAQVPADVTLLKPGWRAVRRDQCHS